MEQLLETRTFGDRPTSDLGMVARYFFAEGYDKREVRQRLNEVLTRCNPDANPVLWGDVLDRETKRASKRKLVEIDSIPVTQSELDSIETLPTRTAKKVAFAYLCVAKYYDTINERNNGWANLDVKDVCSMAGVTLTRRKQHELRGLLSEYGLIQLSRIVDNTNVRVLFIDHNGSPVMDVDDMRNLGNQYFMHLGGKYIVCEQCGAVVPKKSNRQIYCQSCAAKMPHRKRCS